MRKLLEGNTILSMSKRGGVWRPETGFDSFDQFDVVGAEKALEAWLTNYLPRIAQNGLAGADWTFSRVCGTCPFEATCREETLNQHLIGCIPNLTRKNGAALRSACNMSQPRLQDLEDLCRMPMSLEVAGILHVDRDQSPLQSRLLAAVQKSSGSLADPTNRSCPFIDLRQDNYVFVSVLFSPDDQLIAWAVDNNRSGDSSEDLIECLYNYLRRSQGRKVQFVVWEESEKSHLVKWILERILQTHAEDLERMSLIAWLVAVDLSVLELDEAPEGRNLSDPVTCDPILCLHSLFNDLVRVRLSVVCCYYYIPKVFPSFFMSWIFVSATGLSSSGD